MLSLMHFVVLQQHLLFMRYVCLNFANILSVIVRKHRLQFYVICSKLSTYYQYMQKKMVDKLCMLHSELFLVVIFAFRVSTVVR